MAEEGQVSSAKLDVELDGFNGVNVANVDIEDICHEGTLEDVNDGEDQRPHEGVGKPYLVVESVSDDTVLDPLLPWQVNHSLHDQEACHDQLNGSLNTSCNAVGSPTNNVSKAVFEDDI